MYEETIKCDMCSELCESDKNLLGIGKIKSKNRIDMVASGTSIHLDLCSSCVGKIREGLKEMRKDLNHD